MEFENLTESENQRLDSQFVKNMGILGSHMVQKFRSGVEDEISNKRSNSSIFNRNDFSRNSYDRRDNRNLIDDDTLEVLKTNTYNVRIVNAMNDIVDPIFSKFENIQDDYMTLQLQLATDQLSILRKINLTLLEQGDVTDDWIGNAKSFYRRMQDHPALTSLTILGKTIGVLAKGVGVSLKTVLLGLGDRRSDAEKIVDAINKVREFMMTNAVDERKSLLSRVIGGGLLGTAGFGIKTALGAAFGAGTSLAQQRENDRASGLVADNSFSGRISDMFFSSDIIKRNKNVSNISQGELIEEQFAEIAEWRKFREELVTAVYANTQAINTGFSMYGVMDDSLDAVQMNAQNSSNALVLAEETFNAQASIVSLSKETVMGVNALFEAQEESNELNEKIAKYQVKTYEEQVRTRRFMQIKAIAGAIVGGMKTALSAALMSAGALGAGALLKGKSGLSKLAGLKGLVGGKALGRLFTPLAVGESFISRGKELEGQDGISNNNRLMQQTTTSGGLLAGAIGGAKLGAMTGAMFGPIGSAIGSVIGGVSGAVLGEKIGAQAGESLSETFFKNDTSAMIKQTNDQVQLLSDEVVGFSKAQTDAMSAAIKEAMSDGKGSDDIVESIETMTDKLSKILSDSMSNSQDRTPPVKFPYRASDNDYMNIMGR